MKKIFVATNGDCSETFWILADSKEEAYSILEDDKIEFYGDDKNDWDYPYTINDIDEINLNQESKIIEKYNN